MNCGSTLSSTGSDPRDPGAAPSRLLFWAPVLLFDLVLLLLARRPDLLVVGVLGALAFLLILRRPVLGVALSGVGFPLLYPLYERTRSELPAFVIERLIVLAPLGVLLWGAVWATPRTAPAIARAFRALRDPAVLWSGALGALLVAGLARTPAPTYGFWKAGYFASQNLLLLAGAAALLRSSEDPRRPNEVAVRFLQAVLWLQVATALAGVWNWRTHYFAFSSRLITLGLNPIQLGEQMGIGLLALAGLVAVRRIRAGVALATAALLLWVFYEAGSRGPVLALLAGLAFWFASEPGRRGRATRWTFGLLLPAAGVFLLFWIPEHTEGILAPLAGRSVSNAVRLHLIEVARAAVGAAGLFGLGTGAFPTLVGLGDNRYFPHNIIAEVGIENGLIGLLVFVAMCAAVVRRWRRARPGIEVAFSEAARVRSTLVRTAVALLVFSALEAQFAGDIIRNSGIWLWMGVFIAWTPEADRNPAGAREHGMAREPGPGAASAPIAGSA